MSHHQHDHHPVATAPADVEQSIAAAAADLERAQARLVDAVREARAQGYSWARIGPLFGVSRQAAWERFHRKIDEAQA